MHGDDRASVHFEGIEPRLLMAADLVGLLCGVDLNYNGDLLPGTKGTAVVYVANDGDTVAAGKATVSLYASTDETLDGTDILLGTSAATALNLQPGSGALVSLNVALPAKMPAGSYYLITKLVAPSVAEDAGNNVDVSGQTIDVQAPVIDLTGWANVSIDYQIIGSGTGTAYVFVYNQGNIPAVGKGDITVYASTDETFDSGDVVVGNLSGAALNLQPWQDKTYQVNVAISSRLAAGDYYFFAVIDSSKKLGDADRDNNALMAPETCTLIAPAITDTDNNVELSDQTVDVAAPIIDLAGNLPVDIVDQFIGGGTDTAWVNVSNQSNAKAAERWAIQVCASLDPTLNDTTVRTGTSAVKAVVISAESSDRDAVSVSPPHAFWGNSWFHVARITYNGTILDANDLNDQSLTVWTLDVA